MRSLANHLSLLLVAFLSFYLLSPIVSAAESEGSSKLHQAETLSDDFESDIVPILQSRCIGCHGWKLQEAGLRLDSRASLIRGSDDKMVVTAGKPHLSRLLEVLSGTAADGLIMPPEGSRLREDQIELFRRWIDAGLPWPDHVKLDRSPHEVARSHWAFQAIQRPQTPWTSLPERMQNGIDNFVQSRLDREGLVPAEAADQRVLVRRVTLDLIGLPPTPDEVDQFISDESPDAYDRLVDRLLASPHYGERWARPWLDLCHYGDTDGYLTDQKRPVAWRYRQWLIDALNSDISLKDFTEQQIAGDLLPEAAAAQLLGTGYLRNTLSNREGGADLEEYRVEQIIDRTAMVGTAWLGLTVGCARCHDHKYDPLSQQDFYRLYSFFNNTDEVNIDVPLPQEIERYHSNKSDYERQRSELIAPHLTAILELQDRWEKRMLQAVAHPGADYLWDRQWEVLGLIWGGELGEGQLEGCQIVLIPADRRNPDQQNRLMDYFLTHGELIDPARFQELKLSELRTKLVELAKQAPVVTRAPIIVETATPRVTHLHIRGDFRVPGEPLTSAIPDWLTSLDQPQPRKKALNSIGPGKDSSTRLDLARWLISRDNPLTARVFANRSWQEFFGRGIVATPDNFGLQGARPTHPELLDWLAAELHHVKGHFKALHRRIVTSATYRQSSRMRPELLSRDPLNLLLARQSALRLSAEQIRDAVLAASGRLDERIGGPSVFPPQPDAVAMEGFDQTWKPSEGPDRNRRGIYTWLQRLSPFAQGITFDAPANARICARRERSNTPLQALTLLNDPIFWDAACGLRDRLECETPPEFSQRLNRAYLIVLGRLPDDAEQVQLAAHFQRQLTAIKVDAASADSQTTNRPADADQAAWTSIASILLNLHEFITRE